MKTEAAQAKAIIFEFLDRNKIELPTKGAALENFIDHALKYLSVSETIKSFTAQKALITGQLVPAEKASQGRFSFVLEHNLDPEKGPITPTIQVSGTRDTLVRATKTLTSDGTKGTLPH